MGQNIAKDFTSTGNTNLGGVLLVVGELETILITKRLDIEICYWYCSKSHR